MAVVPPPHGGAAAPTSSASEWMNVQPADPYGVLGISPDATPTQISHAYRSLLLRHHPDTRAAPDQRARAADDHELQRIIAAYAAVRELQRRTENLPGRPPGPLRQVHSPSVSNEPVVVRHILNQHNAPIQAGPVYSYPTGWSPARVAGWLLVMTVQHAATADLDASTLYRILALRSAVFVVEQNCVYLDPDGRDLEPNARQVWIERDGEVVAALRLVVDTADDSANPGRDAPMRIGRVVTRPDCRGAGLAAALVGRALQLSEGQAVVLSAQTYLADWYARFGFVIDGPEFLDDGIPHVPMRRPHRGGVTHQPM